MRQGLRCCFFDSKEGLSEVGREPGPVPLREETHVENRRRAALGQGLGHHGTGRRRKINVAVPAAQHRNRMARGRLAVGLEAQRKPDPDVVDDHHLDAGVEQLLDRHGTAVGLAPTAVADGGGDLAGELFG